MGTIARWIVCAAGVLVSGGPAVANCKVGTMLELPVTMSGRQPMVTLEVNGKPARFEVDSGSWYSVMARASAEEFGLAMTAAPPGLAVRGVGGVADTSVVTVRKFGFGKVTIPAVEFLVVPNQFGGAGFIGQNFLGIADVEYDLAGGTIRLMKSTDCGHANLAYWVGDKPYSMLPIDPPQGDHATSTTGTVIVNGVKLRADFDTGASNSMLTKAAAKRVGIDLAGPDVTPAGSVIGFGRHIAQSWIVVVADLKIGDGEEIKNTRVRVGDVDIGSDMLIGADFFLSHRVYVSNAVHKVFLTYNGGPVFNLSVRDADKHGAGCRGDTPAPVSGQAPPSAIAVDGRAEPSDAGGFSRRGAAYASRGDDERALADVTRAVELAPNDPDYLVQRAGLRLQRRQFALARADLDGALKLKPDQPEALMSRAWLRLKDKDKEGARIDLNAAGHAMTPQADLRLALGMRYESADDLPAAIEQYSLWIKSHAGDARHGEALNERCWAQALAGGPRPLALADCNAALRLQPHEANYLDSRALVFFRSGQFDRARADCDAALALNPRLTWSLYIRGLIKQKAGDAAGGLADIAGATAINKTLPDDMKRYGIVP